ncbi:hypothetical protein [Streptomyces sp. NPDC051364]|uniref:hypothetical protein n=1 Tax=Streptomyces sp. NPDC051364 TaxID=3155799 RepID=UPI0034442501
MHATPSPAGQSLGRLGPAHAQTPCRGRPVDGGPALRAHLGLRRRLRSCRRRPPRRGHRRHRGHPAQREIAADPAAARKAVLAQSKGALQADYVDAFQLRYGYGATLSPELPAQLEQEAGRAKAAQSLPGSADRAGLLRHLHPAPLSAVDPAAVTVR